MADTVLQSPPPAAGTRPGKHVVLPGQTPQGEHILGVLVKRTYDFVAGGRCTRAADDKKLVAGDTHYDDPMNSTVKYESDFVPFKLATDVVVHGKAYARPGQRVTTLTASVIVGQHRKDVLVIGDRVARFNSQRDPSFTDPQPFETMDLRYERAYGGVDLYSQPKMHWVYPRNHLGRGFAVANTRRSVDNLPLPNLEDPLKPLSPAGLCAGNFPAWERQPMPQGFGWTMKMWRPRSAYAGVMPADRPLEREMRKGFANLLSPAHKKIYEANGLPDMDFRFFNGASAGLALPYLSGAETVQLLNLDPSGSLQFQLPGERPKIALDIGFGVQESTVCLHTVFIRIEERQVDLVARGAIPYPGPDWLPEKKKTEVLIA
jgi:hypothetical protein